MIEASNILNIEASDLYMRQSPIPNAYILAVSGKRPFVVVHTSPVELLTRKELQAIMAHELGYLKCDHGVWLTFANILTLGAYSLPGLGGLIAQRLEEELLPWLRAAKLACDRAALLVAQDPNLWELGNNLFYVVGLKPGTKFFSIYHAPTRGGHLCSHEIGWWLPLFG